MKETIKKEFVNCSLNKYGEVVDDPINFTIEYEEPNAMCKDIIKILKNEHIHSLSLTSVEDSGFILKIEKTILMLRDVEEIVFKEYYMLINGRRILYNAIFNFHGIDR